MAWGLWFYFWYVVITLIASLGVLLVHPFDRNGRMVQFWAKWWGRSLLRLTRIPLEVRGLEHLVPGRAYVFAANHRSDFDIFALLAVLPGRLMFVAKKELFRIPVFGPALTRMGSISLDRQNLKEAMKALERAAEQVKAGASMIIYPEGTRVPKPELAPFKKGVFIMASKAGQPVVPVSINGTRYIKPRGVLRLKPGPVQVIVSPPIKVQDYPRKEELMAVVFQAIATHYDPFFPYGPETHHG